MFDDLSFFLRVVLWMGLGAALLSALLLVVAYGVQWYSRRAERRAKALVARWQQHLDACRTHLPGGLPIATRAHAPLLLHLWLTAYEAASGETTDDTARCTRLRHLAERTTLRERARELAGSNRFEHQVLGLLVLGHLQDRGSLDLLRGQVEGNHPYLALVAAQAFRRIDAEAAVPVVEQALLRHSLTYPTAAQMLEGTRTLLAHLPPAPTARPDDRGELL